MKTFLMCALGPFLAASGTTGVSVEWWRVRSLTGAAILEDYHCIGANTERNSHRCSCFNKEAHPYDICAHARPGTDEVTDTNFILDTGCMTNEETECFSTPGAARGCGDVWACSLVPIAPNTTPMDFVCDENVDTSLYELVCNLTDKGSCNKTFGECWPPLP